MAPDGTQMLNRIRQRPRKRAEQARAIETRQTILQAALDEFAEFGFEGANVRRIANRAGTTHQLVNYHFNNKDILWQETASLVLDEALALVQQKRPVSDDLGATRNLKAELREIFDFHMANPKLHRFVMQESVPGNPRLPWLAKAYLRPLRENQLNLLDAAQAEGGLMEGDTLLIYYMLIGAVTVIPTIADEFAHNAGMNEMSDELIERYWAMLESLIFRA